MGASKLCSVQSLFKRSLLKHDEANPSVDAVIEQMIEGHEFLRREFGVNIRPRIAWQIGTVRVG
jgi:hypothetical protein